MNIKQTPTGRINVFCPQCKKQQLVIFPKSGYEIKPGMMPSCLICQAKTQKDSMDTLRKYPTDKLKQKNKKQKNRKKYKLRRTLKV